MEHTSSFEPLRNSSFSVKNPLLQIYIDSTSLTEFKLCPRRYYYSIVCGFQPSSESVHLTFGILLHESVEKYWTLRLRHQASHRDALADVVASIMRATWDQEHNKPWQTDNKYKNRYTLMRTVIWYLDNYQDDPIRTISVGDRLAVELPFQVETGYVSMITGEEFILCGRIDRIGELNGQNYITDIKSTNHTLSTSYYDRFNPNNQFTIYTIAAKNAFETEVEGIIVDACQVAQTFSRFDRGLVQRTQKQIDDWQKDLGYFLKNLEQCAFEDDWPMNDSVCDMYGGCPFRSVCAISSESSKRIELKSEYKRRVWDPTFKQMDY